MPVDILDENHLQLIRHFHIEVEADRCFPFALPGVDLHSQLVASGGRKLGGVAPQLPVLEFVAVPEADHQRSPHRLPLPAEGIGDEDVRIVRDVPFSAVLRRKDQMTPLRRRFGNAE